MLKKIGLSIAVISIIFMCGRPLYADAISVKTKITQEDREYFSKCPERAQIAGQDVQDIGPHEVTQGAFFLLIGGVLVGAAFFAFSN